MSVPSVGELSAAGRRDALELVKQAVRTRADINAALGDLVRLPQSSDAEIPGDFWFVCRLDDGTLDLVGPPRTAAGLVELLDHQAAAATVVGWTRPALTAVVLQRGYLVRVTLEESEFLAIARSDLELLAAASCAVAGEQFPEFWTAPDATEAWEERLQRLTSSGDDEEQDEEETATIARGGLLGDGWDEFGDDTLGSDDPYELAALRVADHFLLRPVPKEIRKRRLQEDIADGVEVNRGRFEIVDTRTNTIVSVWRDGLEFEQDLAAALTYQWETPYPLADSPKLYAFRGHVIEVEFLSVEEPDDGDAPAIGDPGWIQWMLSRPSRPIDRDFTLERRIKREFAELEPANRDAMQAVVTRYLPPPHDDLLGQMVTDRIMQDDLTDAQYARWQLLRSDEPSSLTDHGQDAAAGGELTLQEWRELQEHGRPRCVERRRDRIPESVRHEVWRRDLGRCAECQSRERLEFDHIIPWSQGGSDTARNLQLLCQNCNRRKSDRI